MKIIKTITEMKEYSHQLIMEQKKLVFVPTMGFLHEGHLALVKHGKKIGDRLVVSIFVNPTQFGQGEDFDSYPKDFNRDIELLENEGVDLLFFPNKDDLYPIDYKTYIDVKDISNHLCGLTRPGHFIGVATIVNKLFNIVKPNIAIFGMKDYQQLMIIKKMVKDLNLDVNVIGMPTVREIDGLAKSSRNTYLNKKERVLAVSIYKALSKAQELVDKGIYETKKIINETQKELSKEEIKIDYISICDPDTLIEINKINKPVIMAIAVYIGKCRLIDNMIIKYSKRC